MGRYPSRPPVLSRPAARRAGILNNTVLGGGGIVPSATLSTLVSADYTPTADGTTPTTLTFTARDAGNATLEGVGVTASVLSRITVSAGQSDVTAAATTPVDTPTALTIILRDAAGNPVEGIPAELVVVSASGSNNTIVQPTGFSNALGVISGATYTATTSGARTITVTVGGLALSDTPSVNVGGTPGVYFFTEWTRSSTGLTDAEFLDGKWDGVQGGNTGPAAEIVDSDASLVGRGDYFRVNNAGTNSRQIRKDDMVPASTSHWGRVYFRTQRTTGRNNHAISIGGVGGNPINFGVGGIGTASGEGFLVGSMRETDGTILTSPFARWSIGNVVNSGAYDYLDPTKWYLFEWGVTYLTATTFSLDVWVSEVDSTGDIVTPDVWATSEFYQGDYPGSGTQDLATFQSVSDVFGLGGTASEAQRYLFGNDGPGSGATTDSGYTLWASWAISLDGRLQDAVAA